MDRAYYDRLVALAQEGDLNAMFEISCRQLEGDGFEKNPQVAYENFLYLIQQGYRDAEIMIAKMCCHGYFSEQDRQDGARILIDAAEQGNPLANYELGVLYQYGIGCNVNLENAVAFYQRAAKGGYQPAYQALEILLSIASQEQEDDYEDDYEECEENATYEQKDSAQELYMRGNAYLYGKGVKQDTKVGLDLLQEAANQGCVDAWIAMGRYQIGNDKIYAGLHNDGMNVNSKRMLEGVLNTKAAMYFFKQAEAAGSTEVFVDLGYANIMQAIQMNHDIDNASLLEGTNTKAETVDKLIDYLRLGNKYLIRAVQHGHAYAKAIRPSLAEISANIAMWFAYDDLFKAKKYSVRRLKELELESDQCQEAASFLANNERYLAACEFCRYRREALELLAQDGDAAAQGELGSLFIRGDYLGRDCKTGHKWLRIGAENGDATAMVEHAYCLLGFCEGTKNVPLALDWLEKAAETGDPDAVRALAHVLARGVGSQKISYDYKRAMLLYDDLCKEEDYGAMYELAEIYRIGYNTKANLKKAEQLYRRAAELGCKQSRRALSEHFGYNYTTRLLSEWFQESLEQQVVFDAPCPHCGSGLFATYHTFLGQTYWQCPACKGKFLETNYLGRIKL